MAKRTVYIHTLNDEPAMFDGDLICFTGRFRPAPEPAESLAQIRREQRANDRYVKANGISESGFRYGYVRYRV